MLCIQSTSITSPLVLPSSKSMRVLVMNANEAEMEWACHFGHTDGACDHITPHARLNSSSNEEERPCTFWKSVMGWCQSGRKTMLLKQQLWLKPWSRALVCVPYWQTSAKCSYTFPHTMLSPLRIKGTNCTTTALPPWSGCISLKAFCGATWHYIQKS